MEWLTTSTLLLRLGDFQNRDAWERFAGRFRAPIVRFARSLGLSESDADDVAQETLIAFAESHRQHKYDPSKGRLSKWLFGIAYRQALQSRRAGARRQAQVEITVGADSFWSAVPDEHTATHAWDQSWETSLLEQCIQQVRQEVEPVTYRAFELTVCERMKPAAAAEALGIPVKQVYNAKHRVLSRVRELRAEFDAAD